jgi:hypothetical protein
MEEMQLSVNEALLDEAIKEADEPVKTKSDMVNMALAQFITRQKQVHAFNSMVGQVDFDPDWTPRKARGKTW